jgi:heat shock protein HslJ
VSPVEGSTMTITFTPDGQVSGSSGCNDFTGTYALDGTTVSVVQTSSTAKACEPAIMDQETQFLAALQTPATVETSGANVTLRDRNGAMQVGLSPQ